MTSSSRRTRVAILGAGGIGRVYARIFSGLGAEVCAVLGSSEASAGAAAADLASSLGIAPEPFFELERLLAQPLDAVAVCTPACLHLAQLLAVFERGLPAFCEKPLFWDERATLPDVMQRLDALEAHPGRRLFVNTSNAAFIDAVRDSLPEASQVQRFFFRFHTHGPHRGPGIAVDLLPHGLSLLIRLAGLRTLSSFSEDSTDTRYGCRFSYGPCQVEFDFQQGHGGPRDLAFRVDECEFRRVQEGEGATYRVYLEDVRAGRRLRVEDPFRTYISGFLRYCREAEGSRGDQAAEALENMRLMAQILLSPAASA